MRADLQTGKDTIVSRLPHGGPSGPDPTSAYNAAISGDGKKIMFESSPGNQNFAKRYGRIGIRLAQHGVKTRLDTPMPRRRLAVGLQPDDLGRRFARRVRGRCRAGAR